MRNPAPRRRRPHRRHCPFATTLLLLLLLASFPGKASSMEIFDFEDASPSAWQIVNDGVMGGRSQGFATIEEGRLRFAGELVTQGGGFTSVRTNERLDLSGYDGLELRVRGIGREFELEVGDRTAYRGRPVSRRAPFPTTEEWTTVRVPFAALEASVFGQPVVAPALEPGRVRQVGLYILDGIDGPFWLEVDWLRAYREGED